MKKKFFVVALFAGSCSSGPEKVEVPDAVVIAFEQQFPEATNVEWAAEGVNFEATFTVANMPSEAVLDPSGNFLETESEIEPDALPKAAIDYIESTYAGLKISEASKIVLVDGTLNYEAEVDDRDLIFDANGAFVKVL